jgi:hypothetical protein
MTVEWLELILTYIYPTNTNTGQMSDSESDCEAFCCGNNAKGKGCKCQDDEMPATEPDEDLSVSDEEYKMLKAMNAVERTKSMGSITDSELSTLSVIFDKCVKARISTDDMHNKNLQELEKMVKAAIKKQTTEVYKTVSQKTQKGKKVPGP